MAVERALAAVVLVGTGVLTALLTLFAWRRRPKAGAGWFAATMALTTVWVLVTVAGLYATSRTAVLLDRVATGFATVVPALWLCFVLAYTGRGRLLDRRGSAAVWTLPAVVLAALATVPFHDLYHSSVTVTFHAGVPIVTAEPGPLAWANLAYFAVVVVVGVWLIGSMLRDHDRLYSGQAVWLLVGSLAPVGTLVVRLFRAAGHWFPPLALGFSVLGLAYAHGLFNHRLFDLSPASRRIGLPEAFDDLGEGVVVVDDDGNVVAVNARACEVFGCRTGAVLGGPIERVSDALAAVDLDGEGTDVETDGRVLDVSVSRVRDSRDRVVGYALVVRDVTADRRRQQRLAVLDRVFRHNIRNTMNAVVGPTAVLADELEGAERSQAETARGAAEDVLDLCESVRAIERMMTRTLDPVAVSVADAVADATESVRDRTGVAVDAPVAPDLELVTDPVVLALVVEHVVENAAVHAGSDSPTVEISADGRDGGCFVSVSDDGPGIPPSELRALRSGGETQLTHGSGLGLWAIHWGVSRLDGAVRFRRLDSGTRVTLWLPSLDPDAGADVPEAETRAGADSAGAAGTDGPDDGADVPEEGGGAPDGESAVTEDGHRDGDAAPLDEWIGSSVPPSVEGPSDD